MDFCDIHKLIPSTRGGQFPCLLSLLSSTAELRTRRRYTSKMTVPAVRTPFGLRGEPLQHLMLFAVIIPNFVAMGFAQSFFGGIVSYKSVYTLFEQVNTTTTTGSLKAHNSLIQGTVNACLNLGAVIGCLSCMFVGNRLGRRKTVVIGAAIEIIGTILFASAFAYAQLIIGRRTYRTLQAMSLRCTSTTADPSSAPWYRTGNDVRHAAHLASRDQSDPQARSPCHHRWHSGKLQSPVPMVQIVS